jgi:hypothetical protein
MFGWARSASIPTILLSREGLYLGPPGPRAINIGTSCRPLLFPTRKSKIQLPPDLTRKIESFLVPIIPQLGDASIEVAILRNPSLLEDIVKRKYATNFMAGFKVIEKITLEGLKEGVYQTSAGNAVIRIRETMNPHLVFIGTNGNRRSGLIFKVNGQIAIGTEEELRRMQGTITPDSILEVFDPQQQLPKLFEMGRFQHILFLNNSEAKQLALKIIRSRLGLPFEVIDDRDLYKMLNLRNAGLGIVSVKFGMHIEKQGHQLQAKSLHFLSVPSNTGRALININETNLTKLASILPPGHKLHQMLAG